MAATVEEYAARLSRSDVPKLFIRGDPGSTVTGRVREFLRTWPNQTEVTAPGLHFLQEDLQTVHERQKTVNGGPPSIDRAHRKSPVVLAEIPHL